MIVIKSPEINMEIRDLFLNKGIKIGNGVYLIAMVETLEIKFNDYLNFKVFIWNNTNKEADVTIYLGINPKSISDCHTIKDKIPADHFYLEDLEFDINEDLNGVHYGENKIGIFGKVKSNYYAREITKFAINLALGVKMEDRVSGINLPFRILDDKASSRTISSLSTRKPKKQKIKKEKNIPVNYKNVLMALFVFGLLGSFALYAISTLIFIILNRNLFVEDFSFRIIIGIFTILIYSGISWAAYSMGKEYNIPVQETILKSQFVLIVSGTFAISLIGGMGNSLYDLTIFYKINPVFVMFFSIIIIFSSISIFDEYGKD